jgi:hypothetical protein
VSDICQYWKRISMLTLL